MAQTFNDFVMECACYGHSKEHYDLMKECAELTLMESYLADQQFMTENADSIKSHTFTESYFQESATGETVEQITESVQTKAKAIWGKIKGGFKKIISTVVKFFKGIVAKLTGNEGGAATIFESLKGFNLSDDEWDKLGTTLQKIAMDSKLALKGKQPFSVAKLGCKNMNLQRYFAAALSTNKVALDNPNSANVVDGETLCKIMEQFIANQKKADFSATLKLIKAAQEASFKNGVVVKVDVKAIQSVVDRLEKVQESYKDEMDNLVDLDEEAAGVTNIMNEVYSDINAVVSGTMQQYGAYLKFRTAALVELKKFCDSKQA